MPFIKGRFTDLNDMIGAKTPTIAHIKVAKYIEYKNALYFAQSLFKQDGVSAVAINITEDDKYYYFSSYDGLTNFDKDKCYIGMVYAIYYF
jgi:hypothetical protein